MSDSAEQRLFDIARGQDVIMHNVSSELGVKTSLYLVFTVFTFSASLQLITFAKDLPSSYARCSVVSSSISAGISLLASIMFLIAALVRRYWLFPSNDILQWIQGLRDYASQHPGVATEDTANGVLEVLIEPARQNKLENERKGTQITLGAIFLFFSVPFLAMGGALAIYAFFIRPS